jgi:hypothetical protein
MVTFLGRLGLFVVLIGAPSRHEGIVETWSIVIQV